MIMPDKITSFKDSSLYRIPVVMTVIEEQKRIRVIDLLQAVKSKIKSLDEFMAILDILYLIEKIEYNEAEEVIEYVA